MIEHLDRLRRKELVAPEGLLWEGVEVYRFHHVLIRDAAYRSLRKEARAELHERFADWLEDRAGEHEELIALHLERAHSYREQLGPLDERGRELAARAAARLHSAGRRALQREDLLAAANLLDRARHPLAAHEPARLEILADLAEAQLSAGDVEELALRAEATNEERLHALVTAYACQLAILAEAKAHDVAAQAHSLLGEIAAAEAALDRALIAARGEGPPTRDGRALQRRAGGAVGPVPDRARLGALPRRRPDPADDVGHPARRGRGAALPGVARGDARPARGGARHRRRLPRHPRRARARAGAERART